MDSASSKVTVEYHDPAGVFPLVGPELAKHLPLRNLNWQSPSRPLRQIRTLHVEFVADASTQALTSAEVHLSQTGALQSSEEIVRNGQLTATNGGKLRRHQIPGLKTTPYLKVYVLRCDDKEHYKATDRQRVREWIRDNSPGDGQSRQNHDTFEWLIVHVVVPDTTAASEPRWRDSSKDADELKERSKGGAKWPGKSTKTVFDRLRADFNESSKIGPDRVAQIRLRKQDIPPDLLPTPASATTLEETPLERDNAWNDLIMKLKNLILGPFDARVRLYEADIATQESRRSLPGWNFCTFFIHKEGLAMALESIGLAEDALAIYDELILDLETAVREIASGAARDTATAFTECTKDIGTKIMTCLDGKSIATSSADCRNNIVRSSISLLDFFGYIFSRQTALLLRLANASTVREHLGNANGKHSGEDLVLLAELCRRCIGFIHGHSRILREDLTRPREESTFTPIQVDVLVATWIYATADQVLAETNTKLLHLSERLYSDVVQKRTAFGFAMGAEAHPQRSTSLGMRRQPSLTQSQGVDHLQGQTLVLKGSLPRSTSSGDRPSSGIPGKAELLGQRAALLRMKRTALDLVAERCGWKIKRSVVPETESRFEVVDINGTGEVAGPTDRTGAITLPTLLTPILSDEKAYHLAYEELSEEMYSCFANTGQTRAASTVTADLAFLKFQQTDFESASTHFSHVMSAHNADGWKDNDDDIIYAYAVCMRELGRSDEFVAAALDVVRRYCTLNQSILLSAKNVSASQNGKAAAGALLKDAIMTSADLSRTVHRRLDECFSIASVSHYVLHREGDSGSHLLISLRSFLPETVCIDRICARLLSADGHNEELLFTHTKLELAPGPNEILLRTTYSTFGTYLVEDISIELHTISFVHEYRPALPKPMLVVGEADVSVTTRGPENLLQPSIFLYPPYSSLKVSVHLARNVIIGQLRSLEVVIDSASYHVATLGIGVRPTSAGLRIHLADSSLEYNTDFSGSYQTHYENGQFLIGNVSAGSTFVLKVPFSLETHLPSQPISFRLEVKSESAEGPSTFLIPCQISTELPLKVDVNDVFHMNALYSHFSVHSTGNVPLLILGTSLHNSAKYDIHAAADSQSPMLVTNDQPINLVYKITRSASDREKRSREQDGLALKVNYWCIDELCEAEILRRFETDLARTEHQVFTRLLSEYMEQQMRGLYSASELILASLLSEIPVRPFNSIGWTNVLDIIPPDQREAVASWLRSWHAEHHSISVDFHALDQSASRSIVLRVDVPTVNFVHDIELALDNESINTRFYPPVLTVGEPVRAILRIRQTDRWSRDRVYGNTARDGYDGNNKSIRLAYQVHADAETWLVGGAQRAHFNPMSETDLSESRLTLVPLRTGTYPLPAVEVHIAKAAEDVDGPDQSHDPDPLPTCQNNLQSAGQVVQVISGAEQTRIFIADAATTVEAA